MRFLTQSLTQREDSRIKGFTLIEMLVVIAIIGILAGIIMASLSSAKAKGRDARRLSDIKQIQLALSLYYDANGSYPLNIYGSPSPLVAGGYIPSVPSDPNASSPCTADGNTGCYEYVALQDNGGACASPTSYHLAATLESPVNTTTTGDINACPGTAATARAACSSPSNGVKDTDACTGAYPDFSGLSTASPCNKNTIGTLTTQTCYDVTP